MYNGKEEERRTPFPFKDPNPPPAAGSALPKPVRIGTRTTVNDRGGGTKKSSATGVYDPFNPSTYTKRSHSSKGEAVTLSQRRRGAAVGTEPTRAGGGYFPTRVRSY